MKAITGKIGVWITNDRTTPQDAISMSANGEQDRALDLFFYSTHDMSGQGWVRVGTAAVTVEFSDMNEIINNKADCLRKEIQTVRAEAQKKIGALEERLGQLLSLPNYSEEVEA